MEAMRILTVGDCAVSVEFGQEISLEINHKVMALKMVLEQKPIRGIVELIPTYCCLLIQYDPMELRYGQLRDRLEALVTQLDEVEMPPKQVVEIPHIGLPNIVAGRLIEPELLQDDCTPEKIAATALELLEPERFALLQRDLQEVKEKLGEPGAVNRVAEMVLRMGRQNRDRHLLPGR